MGALFTIFSKFAKYYLLKCITSEIFRDFKRNKLHFSEGVYVRRTNFNWRFKPIREIFRFFPKYNDIYLLWRMTSEIFSRFRENFWLLLLLILLLAAICDIINIDGWQWILLTHNSYSDYASTVHMIYLKIWTSSLNYIFSKYARAIN